MADTTTKLTGNWSANLGTDGQTEYVSGSTVVTGAVTLDNGVTLTINSGAIVSGLNTSGSTVYVNNGGILEDTVFANGTLYLSSGALSSDNSLNSVTLYMSSGSTSEADKFYTSAGYSTKSAYVLSGANLYTPTISSGGYILVSSGGYVSGGSLSSNGVLSSYSGSVITNFGEIAGGSATLSGSYGNNLSSPADNGTILTGTWTASENSKGQIIYTSGSQTLSGHISLGNGAVLNITSNTVISGLQVMSGGIATINVAGGATLMDSNIINSYVNVSSGGITSGNDMNSVVFVLSAGASSVDDRIFNSGYNVDTTYVSSGAFLINPLVSSGGVVSTYSGSIISGGKIYASGAVSSAVGANISGLSYVADGFTSSGNYNAATAVVTSALDTPYSAAVLTGVWSAVKAADGSTVYSSGTTVQSGPVTFSGGVTLTIQSGAVVSALNVSGGAPVIYVSAGGQLVSSYIQYANIYVSSGGITSANQYNADAIQIYSGGSSLDDTYYAKDAYGQNTAYINNGGYVSGADVLPGGNIVLYNGAVYSGGNVVTGSIVAPERQISGGAITSNTGATVSGVTVVGEDLTNMLSGNVIGSGATPVMTFAYSAPQLAGTWSAVLNSDKQTVYQSGTTTVSGPVNLMGGMTLYIQSGAVVSGANSQSGGVAVVYVSSGGTLASSYLQNGYVYVSSGGMTSGNQFNSDPVYISAGATSVDDIYYNSGYGVDPVYVYSGGTLSNGYVLSGGSVESYSGASLSNVVSYDGSVNSVDSFVSNDAGNPCFLAGTVFQTPDGSVVVENLQSGDVVKTYNPASKTFEDSVVTWVGKGRRNTSPDKADDLSGYPVRIVRNALADGVPSADLLITAEHALFFNGGFVPVRMLVNGRSIFYDKTIPEYDYYHVETQKHSVLVTHNVLSESYLDTGNRKGFAQSGVVVRLNTVMKKLSWEHHSVAPLTVSRDVVEPLYRDLEERAVKNGLTKQMAEPVYAYEPDFYLLTQDGQVIRQMRNAGGYALFMLPAGVESVTLMSRASRPYDTIGPFVDDRRHLGMLIGNVVLTEGHELRHVTGHFEQSDLAGWHGIESGAMRWTKGAANLRLFDQKSSASTRLSVQVLQAGPYLVPAKKKHIAQVA